MNSLRRSKFVGVVFADIVSTLITQIRWAVNLGVEADLLVGCFGVSVQMFRSYQGDADAYFGARLPCIIHYVVCVAYRPLSQLASSSER